MKITPPYTPNTSACNVKGDLVDPIEYFIELIDMYREPVQKRMPKTKSQQVQKRIPSKSVLMQKIINLEQEINNDLENFTKQNKE